MERQISHTLIFMFPVFKEGNLSKQRWLSRNQTSSPFQNGAILKEGQHFLFKTICVLEGPYGNEDQYFLVKSWLLLMC